MRFTKKEDDAQMLGNNSTGKFGGKEKRKRGNREEREERGEREERVENKKGKGR